MKKEYIECAGFFILIFLAGLELYLGVKYGLIWGAIFFLGAFLPVALLLNLAIREKEVQRKLTEWIQ